MAHLMIHSIVFLISRHIHGLLFVSLCVVDAIVLPTLLYFLAHERGADGYLLDPVADCLSKQFLSWVASEAAFGGEGDKAPGSRQSPGNVADRSRLADPAWLEPPAPWSSIARSAHLYSRILRGERATASQEDAPDLPARAKPVRAAGATPPDADCSPAPQGRRKSA
ncbi:MAG: hypothetical protein ACHQAY_08695 [Hyphomicrobiales bacterium]